MWEYLFESSAWSVGGLIVGYFFGRAEREIRFIKGKVEERDDES